MSTHAHRREEDPGLALRQVTALELFFDLVFVLAVSQLTHHLLAHLGWRSSAETLILLVAVLGVWAFTSFEVTLLDVERNATRALTLGVMGAGLFMNAGISPAFDDGPWLFVAPMLIALIGPAIWAAVAAPVAPLRAHFRRVLVWIAMSTPLWIGGALADPEPRLWWWAAAALLDLVGTWTAHPLPGRKTQSESLPFDAEHMVERMRLLLIILLGETLLIVGKVLSGSPSDGLTLGLSFGTFVAVVALWALYFWRGETAVVRHVSDTADPIRSVHLGINVLYGVMFGLVLLAAGSELVIGLAAEDHAGAGGVMMLVGPALYLLAQAVYFRAATGAAWVPRVVGAGLLLLCAVPAFSLPPLFTIVVVAAILGALAVHQSRRNAHGAM